MTILIFIGVLLVTVIVHEWGHFWTAKRFGMLVEEFGFGIPPRIWSKQKGETLYSINALPFGGFVKISGENGLDAGKDVSRQFESKPWYAQAIVLVAGVVCNLLLAILLFTAAYTIGTPSISPTGTPTVVSVTNKGAASTAGIRVGDQVISITKGNTTLENITTSELKKMINSEIDPLSITTKRSNTEQTLIVTPVKNDGVIMLGLGVEKIATERLPLGKSFVRAVNQTFFVAKSIFITLGVLIASIFNHNEVGGLIGPVGLAQEVRHASDIGFAYLLAFTALISVNLAVLNILPFPALDGGRLVVVLLERMTRRKFSKTVVGVIHTVGFIFLIGLMLVLTVGDVRGLF